jgi:hypothetical protein
LVRYIDWIPLGGWIAWRLLRTRRWPDLFAVGIGFAIPASGNLIYDWLLSGSALLTPTALYGAPGLHNRLAVSWFGFVVTLARVWKLLYAFPPVMLLALLVRRFRATPRLRLHLGLFLANLAIYFFYPAAVGGPGPRYLLAYFPFLVLAVVEVYRFVRDDLSPAPLRLWRFAIRAQVVCALIFAANESYLVYQRLDLERSVEKLGGDKKIVLMKTGANDMDLGDLLRNPPVLSSAETLYFAWDDGGPGLRALLAEFPGRNVYTYEYPGIVHALADPAYFGVTRNSPPGLPFSSIHSAPSGPTSTSRMLWPTLQRSAGVAPPLPSKVMRLSDCVTIPLIKAEPRHCGNIAPL